MTRLRRFAALAILFPLASFSQAQIFVDAPHSLVSEVSDVPSLSSAEFADVDGDGDMDVVAVSYMGFLGWYQNSDGNGTLEPFAHLANNTGRLIDLDGDGDLDIVEPYGWSEHDGVLGFSDFQHLNEVNFCMNDWLLADLNSDLVLDFVALKGCGANELVIFPSTGVATYGPAAVLATGLSDVRDISAADIDGDGDADLLVALPQESRIAAFVNTDGAGTMVEQTVIQTTSWLYHFATADLDGDGDVDILIPNLTNNLPGWSANDGSGVFGPGTQISDRGTNVLRTADMDGDGDLDVVAHSNETTWYPNLDGLGTFGTPVTISSTSGQANWPEFGDLNGDGASDVLLYYNNQSRLDVAHNDGAGASFATTTLTRSDIAYPSNLIAADFDRDGSTEVAVASSNQELWYIDPAASRPHRLIESQLHSLYESDAGDVTGDGAPDIVVFASTNGGSVSYYENYDGSGYFSPAHTVVNYNWPSYVQSGTVADFNGDGSNDLYIKVWDQNNNVSRLTFLPFVGGSNPFPNTYEMVVVDTDLYKLTGADLDGDGDLDLIARDRWNSRLLWFENLDGLGTISTAREIGQDLCVSEFDTGDMDGDGDLDIVLSLDCRGAVALLENTDAVGGTWTESVLQEGMGCPNSVLAHDADGDGDDDVLFTDGCRDEVILLANDGTGTFTDEVVVTSSMRWPSSLTPADMDGDGDDDLIVTSEQSDQIAWFENTGGRAGADVFPFAVCDDNACIDLSFGYAIGATDGFDAGIDGLAPPPAPGGLDGRFEVGTEQFLSDVRAPGQDFVTWTVRFAGIGTVVLHWDPQSLPLEGTWRLTDQIDGSFVDVDMRSTDQYAVTVPFSALDIHYSATVQVPIVFAAGWNMVSTPVEMTVPPDVAFPAATGSSWFEFSGSYVAPSSVSLECGVGYWLHFATGQSYDVDGLPCEDLAIVLAAGWNMIGGPNCLVPWEAIDDPDGILLDGTLFRFQSGYQRAGALEPTQGYWVRATAPGTISLNCGAAKAAEAIPVLAALDRFSKLALIDHRGTRQTLYFGGQLAPDTPSLAYTAPPPAAGGIFQAFYADGRYVLDRESGVIQLVSADFPLTLQSERALSASAFDGAGAMVWTGSVGPEAPLVLENASIETIRIDTGEVPGSFSLEPAYPNPFNPSTTLRFDLPVRAQTTLQVYDALGRRVASLYNNHDLAAGRHVVQFDATSLASGVYMVRLQAGSFMSIQQIILAK